MPRTATETTTKTATKRANAKTAKAKGDKPEKAKRAPSAYNVFMKNNLNKWRSEHEGSTVKEAMSAVAAMWKDSSENPNRGKPPAVRKPKAAPAAKPAKGEKENKKAPPAPSSDEDSEE